MTEAERKEKRIQQLSGQLSRLDRNELYSLINKWFQLSKDDERAGLLIRGLLSLKKLRPPETPEQASALLEEAEQQTVFLACLFYAGTNHYSPAFSLQQVFDPMQLLPALAAVPRVAFRLLEGGKGSQALELMDRWMFLNLSAMNLETARTGPLNMDLIDLSDWNPDLFDMGPGCLLALYLAYSRDGYDSMEDLLFDSQLRTTSLQLALERECWPDLERKADWPDFLEALLEASYEDLHNGETESRWMQLVHLCAPRLDPVHIEHLLEKTDRQLLLKIPEALPVYMQQQPWAGQFQLLKNMFSSLSQPMKPSEEQLLLKGICSARKEGSSLEQFQLLYLLLKNHPDFTSFLAFYLEMAAHPESELYFLGLLDTVKIKEIPGSQSLAIQYFSRELFSSYGSLGSFAFPGSNEGMDQAEVFLLLLLLTAQESLEQQMDGDLVQLLAACLELNPYRLEKIYGQKTDLQAAMKKALEAHAAAWPVLPKDLPGLFRAISRIQESYATAANRSNNRNRILKASCLSASCDRLKEALWNASGARQQKIQSMPDEERSRE